MKRKTPSMFAALWVGLALNVYLQAQARYWSRPGVAAACLSVPVLAVTGWLFARAWRIGADAFLRGAWFFLLAGSSVLELLRLWQLAQHLYPQTVTLLGVCVAVLLPVVYLRRASALSQTAQVIAWVGVLTVAVMVCSLAGQLRVHHLQTVPILSENGRQALAAQLWLYPEYLLPALWPEREKRGSHTVLWLAGGAIALEVAMNLFLELYFGAALLDSTNPVHTAARAGALSVFRRLEWLQLTLWLVSLSLKLALYLYAMVRLAGAHAPVRREAVGLRCFPLYLGGMVLLCVVGHTWDLDAAFALRNAALWVFAALVLLRGAIVWLGTRSG